MPLTGSFIRSIDSKLRVAIPKSLREIIECARGGNLYIAPGTDQCLAIYTESEFEHLGQRLAESSPTGRKIREFTRLFYARAQHVELDNQGRIRIPQTLAELVEIGPGEAVLLGVQDHMELWAKTRWETYLHNRQTHFDEIAEAAFANPD